MTENQTKELKIVDKRASFNEIQTMPTDVIMAAIQKGYTPEFIERMMSLQERFEANNARKAFFESVALFKAEAPRVKKDMHNKYFDSWYTSLGNLLNTYNPVLGKHGLSLSFPTPAQTDKTMTVECKLSHKKGHFETISMTSPIDQAAIGKVSGQRSRNPIQDIKSTFTYLRSATCEAILGVSGTEASAFDDDGNTAAGIEYITLDMQTEINDLIKSTKADKAKVLKYLKSESVEKILLSDYGKAKVAFEAKTKAEKKPMREPGEE